MASITQSFSTPSVISINLTSLGDGSAVDSMALDNSGGDIDGLLEIKTTGTSGSTDYLDIYVLESIDNVDFETSAQARYVGSVAMNGTTAVVAVMRLERMAPYFKVRVINNSGGALSATGSDHSISLSGIKYVSA